MKSILALALLVLSSTFSIAQDTAAKNCPTVTVSGPAGIVGVGELAAYTATVSNAEQYSLEYIWSLSAGRIEDGQGTRSIRVIQPNSSLTVTVDVKGLPEGCPSAVSELSFGDPAPVAEKIFELGSNEIFDKTTAMRLVTVMLEQPTSSLYILAGDVGRKNSPLFQQKQRSIIDLIAGRGITPDRITMVSVYSDVELFQFWRVPPGAGNPTCKECEEAEKGVTKCPEIRVIGPASSISGNGPYKFRVEIGSARARNLRFKWLVSTGQILEGQGTRGIIVDHAEPDKGVTATVEVSGLPTPCPTYASETAPIFDPELLMLVDEYSLPVSQINKSSLKSAAEDRKKKPSNLLYILEYFPPTISQFSIREKVRQESVFLMKELKLQDADFEIVTVEGPETWTKIYLIPPGTPKPEP